MTLIAIVSAVVFVILLCLWIKEIVVDYKNKKYFSMIWSLGITLMTALLGIGIILMSLNI